MFGVQSLDTCTANRCLPDILVDDLEATVSLLRSRGVEFRTGITTGEESYRTATLLDSEGNQLEIYEWVKPRRDESDRESSQAVHTAGDQDKR